MGSAYPPRTVVSIAAILRLKIIPGTRNSASENRSLAVAINIGMQPTKEQRHVPPEVTITCLRRRSQDAVAVSIWEEQNLLDKEGCRLSDGLGRLTKPLGGLSNGVDVIGSD